MATPSVRRSAGSLRSCGHLLLRGRELAVAGRATPLADMRLILLRKIFQRADNRVGSRLPEPAKTRFAQQRGEALQHFQVIQRSLASRDAPQNVVHLHGAGAAWDALTARLIHAEFHEEA